MKDVRFHVCEECGRGFKTRSDLSKHRRVHSGEVPFQCPWPGCGRRFSINSNMHAHHRLHLAPEKEVLTCRYDSCRRTFRSAVWRDRHEGLHKANHPFVAGTNDAPPTEDRQEPHVSGPQDTSKDPELPSPSLSCPHQGCARSFTYPSRLRKHIAAHHSSDTSDPGNHHRGASSVVDH